MKQKSHASKKETVEGGAVTAPKKVTITRKIEIFIDPNMPEEERKGKYKWLHKIRYLTYRAANTVVNHQYRMLLNTMDIQNQKSELGGSNEGSTIKVSEARKIAEKTYNTSIQNRTYQIVRELYPDLPSSITSGINSVVYSSFNADIRGVLRGENSVRNYKLGYPIPVISGSSSIDKMETDKGSSVYFLKWINGVTFYMNFGRDRSGNRSIVDRILSNEYKFCDSSITYDKSSEKWFLLLVVKFDKMPVRTDATKIAATNLGMNCPIVIVTNDGAIKRIGSKEEFLLPRLQFQKRLRKLQQDLVFATGGHGRTRKLKAIDKLKATEKNFAKTYNHKISKAIVMYCFNNGIGKIVTEDLLGASQSMNKEFVLRNWGYYQLQQMIDYKAAQYGIEVEKREPAKITITCNCCHKEDEECVDLDKRVYMCKNKECDKYLIPVDIDENAANNLLLKPTGHIPNTLEKKRKEAKTHFSEKS